MHLTQHVNFEICTECNLGDFHTKCPNKHPDRNKTLPKDGPIPDDMIVDMVEALYTKHGFNGHIGFHYYNEPLMAAGRMWDLMARIKQRVPRSTFVLWTNGLLLPADCSRFAAFSEIHVSYYGISIPHFADLVAAARCPVQFVHWELDDRLHLISDEPTGSTSGCNRMFTELDIDYYGNVHLCCYDWEGTGTVWNVQIDGLAWCLEVWDALRHQVSSNPIGDDAPDTCQRCKVRSMGMLSYFIPEIACKARDFLAISSTLPESHG